MKGQDPCRPEDISKRTISETASRTMIDDRRSSAPVVPRISSTPNTQATALHADCLGGTSTATDLTVGRWRGRRVWGKHTR